MWSRLWKLMKAEVSVCVCVPGTAGWSQKRQKLPLSSCNRDKTWVYSYNTEPLSSTHSRKAHPVHLQRKPRKSRQTWRACYFFCEVIFYPLFVPPGQLVIWRCYKVWGSKSTKNFRTVVETRPLAHTAFLEQKFPVHTLSILTWFDLLSCLFIIINEIAATRSWFPWFPRTSGKITDCSTHDSTESIPLVLPARTEIWGQKETNLNGQKQPVRKLTVYFIINSVREDLSKGKEWVS